MKYWIYDEDGNMKGPYTPENIRGLVKMKAVSEFTVVENEQGKRCFAKKIPGLFHNLPVSSSQTTPETAGKQNSPQNRQDFSLLASKVKQWISDFFVEHRRLVLIGLCILSVVIVFSIGWMIFGTSILALIERMFR